MSEESLKSGQSTRTETYQSSNGFGSKDTGSPNSSRKSKGSFESSKLERVAELLALDPEPENEEAADPQSAADGAESNLLDEISAAARGDDESAADGPDADGQGQTAKVSLEGVSTIPELAERLGVDASDLYAMNVSMGEGLNVSLGELKDAWKGNGELLAEVSEKEARISEREGAVIADQQLFSEIGDLLAEVLPSEQYQVLQQREQARREREAKNLLIAMPELQGPGQFQAMLTRVSGYVERFGVPLSKVQALGSADVYRVLDHAARMQERLDRIASMGAKAKKPKATTSAKGDPQKGQRGARMTGKTGTRADQVQAVSRLLSG